MIAGSVRKIALGALFAAFAALLVPSAASAAAPTVYCVVAYGHENPGNCDPYPNQNTPAYDGRIYPASQPYGYGEKGILFVEGYANPSATVTVSASDGVSTITRVVEAADATTPGDQSPRPFKADLQVHTLGIHEGSVGNPNGIAELTVTAIANVGGIDSPTATTTIDKYAIAAGDEIKDTYKPLLSKLHFPPAEWCHAPVNSIGRIREGNIFGIFGTIEPGSFVCSAEEDPSGEIFVEDFGLCQCVTIINGKGSTGQSTISGLAEDDHSGAFGHAGEISKVLVKITQGTTVIRNYGNVVNRVKSTQAKWDITLKIDDFEPNVVSGADPYLITVEVFDAKGNKQTVTSTFNVYPF